MMPTDEDPENRAGSSEPSALPDAAPEASPTEAPNWKLKPSWWWLLALVLLAPLIWRAARPSEDAGQAAATQLSLSLQYAQAEKFQECVDAARQALKLQPDMPEAYNNLGWCTARLGNFDEAIQNFREALKVKAGFASAMANLNWAQGEKDKSARPAGAPAAPVAPGAATANSLMGVSLQEAQARHYQECIDAARQALKLKPDMPEAYNNIGWCAENMGNWDEALRNAQEAVRLAPDMALAKNNLARIIRERAKAAGVSGNKK